MEKIHYCTQFIRRTETFILIKFNFVIEMTMSHWFIVDNTFSNETRIKAFGGNTYSFKKDQSEMTMLILVN